MTQGENHEHYSGREQSRIPCRFHTRGEQLSVRIINGDCLAVLKTLPDASVQCCVTSPPYWGLRDYGVAGQLGAESTPAEYVAGMVAVFAEVRRVLRDDGTLWLNLGDSYARNGGGVESKMNTVHKMGVGQKATYLAGGMQSINKVPEGLKSKDLIGIPWRVAFALQSDGWYLRQDIIWHKPNPMPESVTDRCTKAHEYIFLMSKSQKYYFDHEAIAEQMSSSSIARLAQPTLAEQAGSDRVPGKTNGNMKAVGNGETRNKRSVWTVATQPFSEAHFATFPPALIEPCILAGCPKSGTVLDPFGGAGTTGLVSDRQGRDAILIELNPEYAAMANKRIFNDAPLFADVT